jgi:myo-inositol-1(or 4)-monophosphatase
VEHLRPFLDQLGDLARSCGTAACDIAYENKSKTGFDPVTLLDRQIETAVRAAIGQRFPTHRVWGEEEGWSGGDADFEWSIDPVDGTRAWICGLPSWSLLIGVVNGADHVAGLIDFPMLDERLIGEGGATRANGRHVRTSGCRQLSAARLSTTDPFLFEGREWDAFERVRLAARLCRYGLDALAYARVATGGLDLVIESGLQRHDYDALVPIVRGAGGHIGDWDGGSDFTSGRIVAAATRKLYEEAVALLSG